jgi:CARDB
MNFVKHFVIFCLFVMIQQYAKAQDLMVDTINVFNSNATTKATVTIKNNSNASITDNARIYVSLYTNTAGHNPIAQIQLQANPLLANATQTFNIDFNSFAILKGFTLNQATQIVVMCDPKNEIHERNEKNNTRLVTLLNIKKPKKET